MKRGGIGRDNDAASPPDELAERRVATARRCSAWTEVEDDLVVKQHGRYLVSAGTGTLYRPYAGAAFGRGGKLEFAELNPLSFVVRDGDVLLLEPLGRTWNEPQP